MDGAAALGKAKSLIAALMAKFDPLLKLRADPSYAGIGIDASGYLQGLLDLAGASSNADATVLIDSHFRGREMLIVPNGVHIKMGPNGAYDVSEVDMLTAIFVKETVGTRISGGRIIGSGKGSQPANHAGVSASDVRLSGSGIVFAGVEGGKIRDVRVENCGGTTGVAPYNGVAGIWLTYGCKNCIVTKCSTNNCRNGINEDNYFQQSPRGNKISKNWITGCRFGIALDSDASATDTLVEGNTIKDCQQSGIDLNKACRVRVTKNHIENIGLESGNSGIWIYGTSSIPSFDVNVEGNTVIDTAGNGIKVGPYVYYPSVLGNKCIGNAKHGVNVLGLCRYWIVADNHCRANELSGINVFRESANPVTTGALVGNLMLQNFQNGLLLDGAAEVTVTGNVIKDNSQGSSNTYDGIRITNATTLCNLVGNQSSGGNQRYALASTDSGSVGNTFSANTFQAGATGRIAFASLVQNWGDNGDGYTSTAGTPTGVYPYGSRVVNTGDNRLYVRGVSGWYYMPLTAV